MPLEYTEMSTNSYINTASTSTMANNLSDNSTNYLLETTANSVIVPSVWALIVVVGTVGNGLVIYILLRYGERSVTNVYIINLAVADLAFVSIVVPITAIHFATPFWTFGDGMCKLFTYTTYVTLHATCLTLTAMTIDRYQAIVYPIQSMNWRSPRASTFVCLGVWAVSFLISLPFALYHKVNEEMVCKGYWPSIEIEKGASLAVVLTTYVIPLNAIIVCYARILHHLWRGNKTKKTSGSAENGTAPLRSAAQLRRKKRVTRMVAIVILLFAVCWLPIHFITLWYRFDPNFPMSDPLLNFKIFAHSLSYANSCVNPFVYAFLNEGFRKAFQKKFPTLSGWCQCLFRSQKNYQETSMIDKAVEARPGMESMASTQTTTVASNL